MADRYRVGVIGRTGKGNYGHGLDSVWKDVDRCQVVAVSDEDEVGREQARQRTGATVAYSDFQQMLAKENLDIVAIAPRWLDQHCVMALAAAENGCHVYMEKPFARDLTEADQIVQAFEMRHLKLAISHQSRWAPAVHRAAEEIRKGLIGKVLEIRARGKEDARRGGGEDLWILGSHVLDLMRLFGGDPEWCQAVVQSQGHPITKTDVYDGNEGIGPLAGDQIHAVYGLQNGAMGYFDSVRGAGSNPSRFGLQIFGSDGIVEVLTGYPGECHVLQDVAWSPGRTGKVWQRLSSQGVGQAESLPNSGLHGGNVAAVRNLLDCIEHPDQNPRCSMYDARWTIEMIAAVFESQRAESRVELPLRNRTNPLSLI